MKKLLVVVDMQNDFVDGALGSAEAQSIVDNVVNKIKEADKNNYDIVFTYDTHNADYMSTEEGNNLPVLHCIRCTDGWELVKDVEELAINCANHQFINKYFFKHTFGSDYLFENLNLEVFNDYYEEIELVGLCTDICVISNAIICKTAQPNAHIVVDASCCAGVTPHSHDVAIEAMKTLQIEIRNEGKEPWREYA